MPLLIRILGASGSVRLRWKGDGLVEERGGVTILRVGCGSCMPLGELAGWYTLVFKNNVDTSRDRTSEDLSLARRILAGALQRAAVVEVEDHACAL